MPTTSHSPQPHHARRPPQAGADRGASHTSHHVTGRPVADPVPSTQRHVLRCLPQDATAIARLLVSASLEREHPGSAKHRYLDDVIPKPWGLEFRVFDAPLVDAWLLHLRAGSRTSEHGHATKATDLLCVRGRGVLTAGDGRPAQLVAGVMVHIEAGALHRTTAMTDLTIVELEAPRDKLDVLRFKDENGRAGRGYECRSYADPRLAPLEPVAAGLASARLRARCIHGALRFGVEPAGDVAARPAGVLFSIALDLESILRRELQISGPGHMPEPGANHFCLTIRHTNQEGTP